MYFWLTFPIFILMCLLKTLFTNMITKLTGQRHRNYMVAGRHRHRWRRTELREAATPANTQPVFLRCPPRSTSREEAAVPIFNVFNQ